MIIGVLIPLAAFFFGFVNLNYLVSFALLLVGLWTIVSAFLVVELKDRHYYSGWGVVVTVLSTFAYLPFAYTVGLLLVALVVLILMYVYAGRTEKMISAAASPPSSPGGTPAANPN